MGIIVFPCSWPCSAAGSGCESIKVPMSNMWAEIQSLGPKTVKQEKGPLPAWDWEKPIWKRPKERKSINSAMEPMCTSQHKPWAVSVWADATVNHMTKMSGNYPLRSTCAEQMQTQVTQERREPEPDSGHLTDFQSHLCVAAEQARARAASQRLTEPSWEALSLCHRGLKADCPC